MPRPNKIWFWKARKEWYVTIEKVRHRLGPDKDQAETEFHELMLKRPPKVSSGSVAYIVEQFLQQTEGHVEPTTHQWYQERVLAFLESLPSKTMNVRELKPLHVTTWLNSQPGWGDSVRRGAITAVCRVFNWAKREGYIDESPLKGIKKPPATNREEVISKEEFKKILKHVQGNLKDVLVTTWETGCRPREVLRVEARWVDLQNARWVFPVKKSKGKKRQRVVYLSDNALKITKRLMKLHPEGPIFRNEDGNPWTAFAIACGFTRLKKKIGKKYCLQAFRHSFITNGLKNSVDPITMQNLVGHASLDMISKVYAHVHQDVDHMRKSLKKVQ